MIAPEIVLLLGIFAIVIGLVSLVFLVEEDN